MKINRFIALAAIALLVVAGLGTIATSSLAKSYHSPAAQAADCSQQDDDSAEIQGAPDTDDVEEQCGDQNEADTESGEEANGLDTDNVEEQVGDQNEADTVEESESAEDAEAAPTGTPAITADEAQTAALTAHSGTVVQTELDDENGQLVYSVEFDGGVDVKVDAMTGEVLSTETGQD